MTNRDKVIFGAAWALILAGIVVILGLAIHPTGATAAPKPAVCHFDGGGSITAGNAARTTEGTVWACTEAGTLVRWDSGQLTPWQRVFASCAQRRDCVRTPAAIRRADGIGPHVPSWTRYGDTTYTWVKRAHGTVQTFTS